MAKAKSTQLQSRISAVAKDLASGKERAEILRKYAKKWRIAERTIDRYLTNAKQEAEKLRKLAETAATDTLVQETIEAVKTGLKTKQERLLILQGQVDAILEDLKDERLKPTDRAYLRKTLKDIQAEISKIEGDYAPIKQANTDKDGNDLHPPPDLSKLSRKELDELERILDKTA
jgi:ATP-dependent Lon protease